MSGSMYREQAVHVRLGAYIGRTPRVNVTSRPASSLKYLLEESSSRDETVVNGAPEGATDGEAVVAAPDRPRRAVPLLRADLPGRLDLACPFKRPCRWKGACHERLAASV